MPKDTYRPYQPDHDGTFASDEEPDHSGWISTRRIDGRWRVVALEPGHCEHLHHETFSTHLEAIGLAQRIRKGLASGLQLNFKYWETRAR